MTLYRRVEINNLAEIQKELIDYNFFEKFMSHGPWETHKDVNTRANHEIFTPTTTSAGYFTTVPDLKHLKEFLNNTVNVDLISHFFVMNFVSKFSSGIHKDVDSTWALNIPIINYSNSRTLFYNKDQEEIGGITLDAPYFLKVGGYHQIINNSNQCRLSMSIRFSCDDLEKIIK